MKTPFESVVQAIITAGWSNQSDGDVDAPTGHFAIVEVPALDKELADMVDALLDTVDGEEVVALCTAERGHYMVVETSEGQVHITGPFKEAPAKFWFLSMQKTLEEWTNNNPEY